MLKCIVRERAYEVSERLRHLPTTDTSPPTRGAVWVARFGLDSLLRRELTLAATFGAAGFQRRGHPNTGYALKSNRLHIRYADMLRQYDKLVSVAVQQNRSQSVPACRIDARQHEVAEM